MNSFFRERWRGVVLAGLLVVDAVAGVYGLCALDLQAAWLPLVDGRTLWVWSEPWRVAGAALAFLALGVASRVWLRVEARRATGVPSLVRILAPLSWVAFLPLILHARPLLPQSVASSAAFWGLAAVLASVAARTHARLVVAPPPLRRPVLGFFIAFSLFYTLLGAHFTHVAGSRAGDENHYLTIARSLREDGDLDIRNNVDHQSERWRERYHISPLSRGDHWYSEHPVGLSLLLFPVVDAGLLWRHLVLGLLSGAGAAGMVRLAMLIGAPAAAAMTVSAVTSLGMFWGIYSCRVWPEVLGATLAVWMFVGLLTPPRLSWSSMALVLLTGSFLPWAHVRFVPVVLVGFGFYGLSGLWRPPSWPYALRRLVVFALLGMLGLGLFFGGQRLWFEGSTSYAAYEGLLFSSPPGMWESVAGNRGILVSMPAFVWMWWAAVVAFVRFRTQRFAHLVLLMAALAVLSTACATEWFSGGTCLPGRFLVVVTPLLAASAAVVYAAASRPARGLFLLLSGYSMALFLLWVVNVNRTGASYVHPLRSLGWHVPALGGLLDPLREPGGLTQQPFSLLLHIVTLLLVANAAWPRWLPRLLLASLGVGAIASHVAQPPIQLTHDPAEAAGRIAQLQRPGMRVAGRAPAEAAPLFAHIDHYFGARPKWAFSCVTTDGPGADTNRNWVSQSRLAPNDWQGRPIAWTTLTRPSAPTPGTQTLQIEGRLDGAATLHLVVRNGSRTLVEEAVAPDANGRVTFTRELETERIGDLYLLARLDGGPGLFTVDAIHWAPTPAGLLHALNLLPP
jgi:hypothetical protein